jgi:hypothetical protein
MCKQGILYHNKIRRIPFNKDVYPALNFCLTADRRHPKWLKSITIKGTMVQHYLAYLTKAAELGEMAAHFCLGDLYYKGRGVEKDMTKAIHHLEKAAIGGHPDARVLLSDYEEGKGRPKRAAKHLIINANLGCEPSLKFVKDFFVQGVVSKEEYAAALRGYQAAANETKSAEREKGEHISGQLARMGLV